MFREVAQVSSVLGRRTVLKYAMLGLAGAVVSACDSKSKKKKRTSNSDDQTVAAATGRATQSPSPSPSPSPSDFDLASLTFEAFVKGAWKVTAAGSSCVLTVGGGKWALSKGTPPAGKQHGLLTRDQHGTYSAVNGSVSVQVFEGDDTDADDGVASNVPALIGKDRDMVNARWSYDNNLFNCPVKWDGTTLSMTVSHARYGGQIAYTATRA